MLISSQIFNSSATWRLLGGSAKEICGFLAGAACLLAGITQGDAAEAPVSKEYQIKAAFLYNFTKFAEWPDSAFADPKSPIVIGVLGANPFGGELAKAIEGRKVNGRDLVLKPLEKSGDLESVHVLFTGSSEEVKLIEALGSVNRRPILTVGETDSFAKHGGIITFILEGDKVRFEINMDAADQAGLKISAQLQKLAKTIRRKS